MTLEAGIEVRGESELFLEQNLNKQLLWLSTAWAFRFYSLILS